MDEGGGKGTRAEEAGGSGGGWKRAGSQWRLPRANAFVFQSEHGPIGPSVGQDIRRARRVGRAVTGPADAIIGKGMGLALGRAHGQRVGAKRIIVIV